MAAAEVVEGAAEDVVVLRKGVVVAAMVVVGAVEVVAPSVVVKMGRPASQPTWILRQRIHLWKHCTWLVWQEQSVVLTKRQLPVDEEGGSLCG